ncbi:MAG: FHA domain-containing protein [Archangium sp.]
MGADVNEINIAPHLERALDAMSKDLAIDRAALVNQAVFAWLRINGYVSPGAQQPFASGPTPAAIEAAPPVAAPPVVAPVAAPPPQAAPAPAPAPAVPVPVTSQMKAHVPGSSPSVVAESAQKIEAPPPPPAEPVAAPASSSPSGGQVSALARMKEIASDLEKLTRPWPAWVAQEEEEEEEEEEQQEEQEEQQEQEEAEEKPESRDPFAEDEEEQEQEQQEKPEPRDPFEAELPEATSGETEDREAQREEEEEPPPPEDESVGESTVVLRSVPIVLYLEREGADPVRVDVERFIIGRGPTCNLVIDSPRVSREHAVLTRQGIRYFIEDLNSSNGTWYGEERVGTREIESGDVISLGNEPVTFILRGE